jgi:ribonuclease P protein component
VRLTPEAPPPRAVGTLKRRADFLNAARGRRASGEGFGLQALNRQDGDGAIRVGFTCSRKVGNSVTRNRARRRLRAAARAEIARHGRGGWDYVLIGRAESTVGVEFRQLCAGLAEALIRLHTRA